MKGLIPDVNIEGYFQALLYRLEGPVWHEVWASLDLRVDSFAKLGLPSATPDAVVWRLCQARELILLTNNRNADAPDSLENTIRAENTLTSLPIFTIADGDRVLESNAYAERVAEKLLESLMRIDQLRGTGRLFLP